MLEIILLVFLCSAIGKMARARGRSAGGYQFMLVAFWIIGEVLGIIMGVALTAGHRGGGGDSSFLMIVLGGLVGAGCGAGLAFLIVGSLPAIDDRRDDYRRRGYERDFDRSFEGDYTRGRDHERERWNAGRPEDADADERYRRDG